MKNLESELINCIPYKARILPDVCEKRIRLRSEDVSYTSGSVQFADGASKCLTCPRGVEIINRLKLPIKTSETHSCIRCNRTKATGARFYFTGHAKFFMSPLCMDCNNKRVLDARKAKKEKI